MAIDDNTSYELTGAQVKDLANKIKAKAADNIFVGATSAAPGSKGLVPQPQAGDEAKVLSGAGAWVNQPTVPTVNDATLTLVQNGTIVGTFTANQNTNTTVNLAGGIYADDPTTQAQPTAWVTNSDIDWSSIMTVLYDGGATGTNGNVTLSQSSAGFTRIRIFYRSSDNNFGSVDVYSPNGKYIMLGLSNMTSSGGWIKVKRLLCSGTTLSVDSGNSGQISLPSTWSTGGSYIYITRVEGWKI